MIDPDKLEEKISELLDSFYDTRLKSLQDLPLRGTLARKNPYLYRAVGVADASEIIEQILTAFVSSSDETRFGNEFFEPLTKFVAQEANIGNAGTVVDTSHGEGVDIHMSCDGSNGTMAYDMPIAVKSGINVFNSDSKKKQGDNFESLRKRLQKLKRHFDPVVGYCYGRKQQRSNSKAKFRELAGHAFWTLLTGEPDFYLRVVGLMKQKPLEHKPKFQEEFDKAKNRFTKEFLEIFSTPDGSINWDKLVEFNSGPKISKPKKKRPKKKKVTS
jgi:hypothetical protein